MKFHLKRYKILIVLLLCSLFGSGNSFPNYYKFKNFSTKDGFPSNTVYAFIQDRQGRIWIGTEEGLCRYNGYKVELYRHNPYKTSSLCTNQVYCLKEGDDGDIWVGTQDGVSVYHPNTNSFSPFHTKTSSRLAIKGRIQNILKDKKGNIWFAVYAQGVFCYQPRTRKLSYYSFSRFTQKGYPDNLVTTLYIDASDRIWAAVSSTWQQVFSFDAPSSGFRPAYAGVNPNELSKLSAQCIFQDHQGTLWFGTWDNGLCRIDEPSKQVVSFLNKGENQHIHSIAEPHPGQLMVGSDNGLTIATLTAKGTLGNATQMQEADISNRFVYPIFRDNEGGIWVGTYYGGINYWSPYSNYFKSYAHDKNKNSISGHVVSQFCEDAQGRIWIGTDDNGINCFDPKTQHFSSITSSASGLSYHNVHGLCIDGDDLWIGTYTGGVNKMSISKKTFKRYQSKASDPHSLYSNSSYSIYKDSRGQIWVGTTSGINLYDRQKDYFLRILPSSFVMDITEDKHSIWFATMSDGLFALDKKSGKWKNFHADTTRTHCLPSNAVVCLCATPYDGLWVGTDKGICIYNDKRGSFENVALLDGLTKTIKNIVCDNQKLWITTSNGLMCYDLKTQNIRTFNEGDGLLDNEFTQKSGFRASNGTLYFGTAKGFNTLEPTSIALNIHIPKMELTDFQISNRPVDINKYRLQKGNGMEIKLAHGENSFSFEYAVLSFISPGKSQYAYMLENFDKTWNYVGNQRKATYTNIPSGTYYFRVKASNNDGVWNNNGLVIKVVVKPPLWLTTWAILFYVLLAGAILYYILQYYKRRTDRINNEKIEHIKIEKEKEAYDSKISFFTQVAHEIRTPVSLIIGPLEKIIQSIDSPSERFLSDLQIINKNSQRLLFLTNQILDFRKMEEESIELSPAWVNLDELLSSIFSHFQLYATHKNVEMVYTCDKPAFEAFVDTDNLTKVVSNLLSNAIKFTKDRIELKLSTQSNPSFFRISVSDNGAGIAEEHQEMIFKPFYQVAGTQASGTGLGLHLVKSIVSAFHGTILLESTLGEGTSITVEILRQLHHVAPLHASASLAEPLSSNFFMEDNEPDKADFTLSPNSEKPILLVIEDNSDMRQFLNNNFSSAYQVLSAANGLEGIRQLEKHAVNIIICDLMMPEMNGIEFCEQLSQNILWNHIPVIILTAKTKLSSKIQALEIGADAYIEKPFSLAHVDAQLKNLLNTRKALIERFTSTPFSSLKSIAGNKMDEEFLVKVNKSLENNIQNIDYSIENMAQELGISSSGLFVKIKSLTGMTPNKLLLHIRLKKAYELLQEQKYKVNEVCFLVGFTNPSYFAKCFHDQFKIYPKELIGTNK